MGRPDLTLEARVNSWLAEIGAHVAHAGEVAQDVERGALWLDARHPRWFDHIDLGTLQLSNPDRCVLGQLAASITPGGSYEDIASERDADQCVLDFLGMDHGLSDDDAFDYGFNSRTANFVVHDVAWHLVIEDRQQ